MTSVKLRKKVENQKEKERFRDKKKSRKPNRGGVRYVTERRKSPKKATKNLRKAGKSMWPETRKCYFKLPFKNPTIYWEASWEVAEIRKSPKCCGKLKMPKKVAENRERLKIYAENRKGPPNTHAC